MISQAPLSHNNSHEIAAEKMLVDIIAEKGISRTFSPSELPSIYENFASSYNLDWRKINRYAGRRGKEEIVKKYREEADRRRANKKSVILS